MSERRSLPKSQPAQVQAMKGVMTIPKLSVVIPAYNEENSISAILDRVLGIRPGLQAVGAEGPEIIVVDDGSRDRTAEIVGSYQEVRLIRHAKNRGYGGALKTGFCNATGNLLAFLDADGTYPPEHFPELCRAALNGADLVIGSRMAGAESEMPPVRRLGNLIFATSCAQLQRLGDGAPLAVVGRQFDVGPDRRAVIHCVDRDARAGRAEPARN